MALHSEMSANTPTSGQGENLGLDERSEAELEEDLEEGEIADEEEEVKDNAPVKEEHTKDPRRGQNGATQQDRADATHGHREHRRRSRASQSDDEDREITRKKRRHDLEEVDEFELELMNIRGHSPLMHQDRDRQRRDSGDSDYDRRSPKSAARGSRSGRTGTSRKGRTSPRRDREKDREKRREKERERDRDRERKNKAGAKVKEESICAFYMEGKCSRGSDCPYSHAAVPPRKMELCKFYMMECCAKKDKCLYMHKDFPCKFFHTGRKCRYNAEQCKFSHEPLSETTRAILIKHIETAPREILGDFPRMSREEVIQAVDAHSGSSASKDKRPHIPSLFEINLGPPPATQGNEEKEKVEANKEEEEEAQSTQRRPLFYQDMQEADDSKSPENSRSIWFGQLRQESTVEPSAAHDDKPDTDYLATLPRRQRELFLRVQQQQREPSMVPAQDQAEDDKPVDDQWYSSDEEGEGKSLSDVLRKIKRSSETGSPLPASNINLSNINVENLAKALSTINSKTTLLPTPGENTALDATSRRDPRVRDPRMRTSSTADMDLRVPVQDVDLRVPVKAASAGDVDLRASKLPPLGSLDDVGMNDIDLRRFHIPFTPVTPAFHQEHEIDASYDSHPPFEYRVIEVDKDPPNYSSVRITASMTWASLDPRLQKGTSEERSVTSTEPPSIPLGPASPDPVVETYGREPETLPGFQQQRQIRDPRRAAAAFDGGSRVGLLGVAPTAPADPRAKPGLLGIAPPGILPHPAEVESSYNSAVRPNLPGYERLYEVPGQASPRLENRRDPRQRNRMPTSDESRSFTPPMPAERIFR